MPRLIRNSARKTGFYGSLTFTFWVRKFDQIRNFYRWNQLNLSKLTLVVGVLCTIKGLAATDPNIPWRMLNTPHFTIIYDARQKSHAERYAQYAEEAYLIGPRYYREAPSATAVVIYDSSDTVDGNARSVPYPWINLVPTLPSLHDNIGTYGNWSRELILHEFTHILAFEPSNGIWKPLRYVFGSIARPNQLLPVWYHEGIAMDMETREGQGGRLRNPYYHAMLRAMALDRSLDNESLARMNERRIPVWPLDRPYVLGAFMVQELNQLDGSVDIQPYLINAYSYRIPYFLTAPLEERLDLNYEQVFASMVTRAKHTAEETAAKVRAAGLTPTSPVENRSLMARSPVISPDGKKLAFIAATTESDGEIFILDRNDQGKFELTKQDRPVVDTVKSIRFTTHRVSWSPDSQKLIYAATFFYDRFYTYSDIYIYDVATGENRRLTTGLRAMEPAFSLDGQKIAFRQNIYGKTQLAEIDVSGVNHKVVYNGEDIESRVAWPEYISENEIAFSERLQNKFRLMVVNRQTGQATEKLNGYEVQFLRRSPRGLLFSAENSGISNIYLASADLSTATPLSNVVTRALAPEYDAQSGDVYITLLHGDGTRLERIAAEHIKTPAKPPKIELPPNYRWTPTQVGEISRTDWSDESYSAWRYMIPRYWYPNVTLADGSSVMMARTGSTDPLLRHQYSAAAMYDSQAGRPGFSLTYKNAQTRLPVEISATDQFWYLSAVKSVLHSTQGRIDFDPSPWLRMNPLWTWTLGWDYYRSDIQDIARNSNSTTSIKRTGPNTTLTYSNAIKLGYQISPERGVATAIGAQHYIQQPGYSSYERYSATATGFLSSFTPEHHVIMMRGQVITTPRMPSIYLGAINSGADYNGGVIGAQFVTRGYAGGTFWAKDMALGTTEYRFPIWEIQQGGGTQPIFTRRLHGALVSDVFTLRGDAYDSDSKIYRDLKFGNQVFWGGGAELKLDLTLFYTNPITLNAGYYFGNQRAYQTAPTTFNFGVGYQATF